MASNEEKNNTSDDNIATNDENETAEEGKENTDNEINTNTAEDTETQEEENEIPPQSEEQEDEKPRSKCLLGISGVKISDVQGYTNRFRSQETGGKIEHMKAFSKCLEDKKDDNTESKNNTESSFSMPDKNSPNVQWKDSNRSELHYYLSTLRLATTTMSCHQDRLKIRRWVFYLLRNVNDKILRNRYLLLLTISALADECISIIKEEPPSSIEKCLPSICPSKTSPARWESDMYWDRLVLGVPCNYIKCPIHKKCIPNIGLEEGAIEAVSGHLMDQEFKYFLYLLSPFVSEMKCPFEKTRISMWVQTLGSILPTSCVFMKGLRNDYMQALLGYVSVGKSPGPFKRFPPDTSVLLPIAMEAKKYSKQPTLAELRRQAADEFLSKQKPIENGALCYIAICGNEKDRTTFNPFTEI